MRFTAIALLLFVIYSPVTAADADALPGEADHKIAIGIDDETVTLLVPTATGFRMIRSLVEGARKMPGLDRHVVIVQLVPKTHFECDGEIILFVRISSDGTTIASASNEIPYDVLPGLTDAIESMGFHGNATLVSTDTLASRNGNKWVWQDGAFKRTEQSNNGG